MARNPRDEPLTEAIHFSITSLEKSKAEQLLKEFGADSLAQVSRMFWRKGFEIFTKLAELDRQLVDQEIKKSSTKS